MPDIGITQGKGNKKVRYERYSLFQHTSDNLTLICTSFQLCRCFFLQTLIYYRRKELKNIRSEVLLLKSHELFALDINTNMICSFRNICV